MPRSRSTRSRATRRRSAPASARRAAPVAVRTEEVTGSSAHSWDDAVAEAVRGAKGEAAKPLAVEVIRFWADLDERRRIRTYQVAVKLAYQVRLARP